MAELVEAAPGSELIHDGNNVEVLYTFPNTQSFPNGIATSPQHLFFTENAGSVVTKGIYRSTLNGTSVKAITGVTNQLPTPNQIRDIEYSNGKLFAVVGVITNNNISRIIPPTAKNPFQIWRGFFFAPDYDCMNEYYDYI